MSDLAEVRAMVEELGPLVTELRSEADTRGERDGLLEAKIARMAEEAAARSQELQAARERIAANEAKTARLEAALGRPDTTAGTAGAGIEERAQLATFLRGRATAEALEMRAMSTDVGPAGGFLVAPNLVQTIVSRIFDTSPLRPVANVLTTANKAMDVIIDDNEVTAAWSGERAFAAEATPDVGVRSITVQNVTATMQATADMIDDAAIDIAGWLIGKASDRISRHENVAFVSGNGVSRPRGFTTFPNWTTAGVYQRDRIEQIVSGAAANVTTNGIINLQFSLPASYHARAVFGMHRSTFAAFMGLSWVAHPALAPLAGPPGQMMQTILGRPVILMEDMPLHSTAGNLAVVYADFSRAYTILDRTGITVLRDPFTAKPSTQFNVSRRVGGDVTAFDAIKLMRIAA